MVPHLLAAVWPHVLQQQGRQCRLPVRWHVGWSVPPAGMAATPPHPVSAVPRQGGSRCTADCPICTALTSLMPAPHKLTPQPSRPIFPPPPLTPSTHRPLDGGQKVQCLAWRDIPLSGPGVQQAKQALHLHPAKGDMQVVFVCLFEHAGPGAGCAEV